MKKEIYEKSKEIFPNIDDYEVEIFEIESFLKELNVEEKYLDLVFWNHMISLFERIDTDSQNDMDIEDFDEIHEETKRVTQDLVKRLNVIRQFNITNMENLLINIHIEKMLKGGK